jgi:hypothetical protein
VQSLTVPTTRNPNDHSPTEILDALRGTTGSRRWSFRYDLLDRDGQMVGPLENVLSCKISQNWLADIKRTARFTLRDTGGIDYLSDRIRPWIRLHLPPYGPADWAEWPQGVFLLSTPRRRVNAEGLITREVEAYDQIQVYADDLVASRYYVPFEYQYMSAIRTLLGITSPWYPPVKYPPLIQGLPVAKEWPPGTSKLKIINELLSAVNHESLSFDEMGGAVIRPYIPPSDRAPEFTYASDQYGLIVPELDQELDLFTVPNRWVLVFSEPEVPPLVASYTNSNPTSPTSTVRRGRIITDFRTEQEAADLATLQEKAARLAFEASQIFEAIEFSTAMMPFHSGNDVYNIVYDRMAINAKYAEQSWEIELRAGATMKHRARRVVSV